MDSNLYYNDFNYNNKPIKLSEFISDKYNKVHDELYKDALYKYIQTECNTNVSQFLKTHKCIEIKNKVYDKPSSVFIIDYTKGNRYKIDLTPYWNTYQTEHISQDISYIYTDEDTKKDAELIYIDYVNGKSKLKSRFTGESLWVDNNYINSNTRISSDFTLNNTFTYIVNHNYIEQI